MIFGAHGEFGKVFMAEVLIVAKRGRHDAVGEIIQRGGGEDDVAPRGLLLLLRIGGLVILLTYPHQNTHWVVVQRNTYCLWLVARLILVFIRLLSFFLGYEGNCWQ